MRGHDYFEELSARASLGELTDAEFDEFTAHLQDCFACQQSSGEFHELAAEHLALTHRGGIDHAVPQRLREATLRRIADEGLPISPEAMLGREARHLRRLVPHMAAAVLAAGILTGAYLLVRHDLARLAQPLPPLSAVQYVLPAPAIAPPAGRCARACAGGRLRAFRDRRPPTAARRCQPHAARLLSEQQRGAETIRGLEEQVAQLNADKAAMGHRAAALDADFGAARARLAQMYSAAGDRDAKLAVLQRASRNSQTRRRRKRQCSTASRSCSRPGATYAT